MSSSAIATPTFQAKIGSIQNQADTSAVYNAGVWSFKNSTAVTNFYISNSGDVGIGSTSPEAPLHIRKINASVNSINVGLIVDCQATAAEQTGAGTAIVFRGKSAGGDIANYLQAQIATNNKGDNNAHGLTFFYKPNAASALTEAMRIDSSGKVGISTGTPMGAQLEIFNNAAAGHLRISTLDQGANDSSRADIDFHVNVRDHTVARLGSFYSSSASGGSGGLRVFTRSNGTLRSVAAFNESGSLSVGASTPVSISPDRLVFATGQYYVLNGSSTGVRLDSGATSWVAQSDERSKKNIKPLELGLEQIKALKPSRFDYKTDESEQSARVGFIAQEVLPVLPHAVFGEENSEQMLGVSATEMIPVLVKAIQEQQEQIEALKAEVAALKVQP